MNVDQLAVVDALGLHRFQDAFLLQDDMTCNIHMFLGSRAIVTQPLAKNAWYQGHSYSNGCCVQGPKFG